MPNFGKAPAVVRTPEEWQKIAADWKNCLGQPPRMVGNREEVFAGTAYKTKKGLTRECLELNKKGRVKKDGNLFGGLGVVGLSGGVSIPARSDLFLLLFAEQLAFYL